MDRRMRPAAALRALLTALALVLGGLTPTAAATTAAPYADGTPYAATAPAEAPHAHDGSAHHASLHAVLRTGGRTGPAEQHVAHPAPGLGPAGRHVPRTQPASWLPGHPDTTGRQQFSAGLRPARAPPSNG
ncbi:hypothetical protein C3486_02465 [Streptomyces sp. Ru73]|uniref:hypothetical protein n=1 Tax=Streptomyces sp. Ru73 TaxID=2080748 RepID=UPI000CDD6C7F|nr:hypothetical protein [Streptomyces sp. Ru73]POX43098.1 hypothetical protein C3486_02465 [Streptomyces sp. Ru73]